MKLIFYGHSCFGIKTGEINILIDPFITGNPLASDVNINLIKADYILLTHAHQDHILDVEFIAKNTKSTIISNYEIAMYYKNKGFKVYPINHGGNFKNNFFSLKYVNAINTSSFEDGSYGGEPGGFLIFTEKKSIYIAGDTALTIDMKLIPMQTNLKAAILPIGDTFTMGIKDALIASNFIKCDTIIGCHYNTFPSIEIDTDKAKLVFKKANKKLLLPEIGNYIKL